MKKTDCWGNLAIPPPTSNLTSPGPQLQLQLLSPLQNSIIYHKMYIIKSAWINP